MAALLGVVRGGHPRQRTPRAEERRALVRIEMWECLIGVAEERRRAPADDLVSVLARRGIGGDSIQGGDQLSEAELAMFLIQLLVAGNETTRNLISAGLVALAAPSRASGRPCGRTGTCSRAPSRSCCAGRRR